MPYTHPSKGFSLIEVLITISLAGILTLCCIPLYSHHVARAHRHDAQLTLIKLSIALEEYHTAHFTYVGATLDILGFPKWSGAAYYQLKLDDLTQNSYRLSAQPIGRQESEDASCGALGLNNFNERYHSGPAPSNECW